MKIKQRQILVGQRLPKPPSPLPPNQELLRIRLNRIMDDGTQTLGIMDILNEDGSILYSLATTELPWKENQNKVSCVPPDNYRVISYCTGKHGKCFWLIGNEQGEYINNKITGNGYTRGSILIHAAPKATKNLQGCIGPGLKFNSQTNQTGIQKGTGQFYLSPSKEQSTQALNKLVNTLWGVGSFRMEINNLGFPPNVDYLTPFPILLKSDQLPNWFDRNVQQLATDKNLLPNPYIAPK
tara:strand:- start:307 stop:1023 length:717 start_codon:yes stop_codon:yes gene_type:complete